MEEIETTKKDDWLSIIIENIEFTLIYKTTTYTNAVYEAKYNLPPIKEELSVVVKIRSVNLDTKVEELFWVYLSFSELGVWRFACYDRPNSVSYDKGKEYVQATCINMDLQKHIHLCYDRLDEIVSPHEDIINTPSRKQPGFESIIDQNINLSQKYISKYSFIIHDSNREKYIFDKKNIPIKCGSTRSVTEENVIHQIQSTSSYLEDNYVILSYEEIFRYNFVFRGVINSENIVMKVTLKNKNTDETIILFYKKMFFSKLNSQIAPSGGTAMYDRNIDLITKDGNEHFVVILVIPGTSRCLNNSLYSEYIHLGIYVCKPFEYTRTINLQTKQCTKDYSYVGYRYENIFPIKNIENTLSSVREKSDIPLKNEESKDVAGGKRSKRKNINNNGKRKSIKNKKTKRKYKKSRKSRKYKKV
jgi:hypothetical protein